MNLSWIKNLPSVGAPIRDWARDIERQITDAETDLEIAKVRYNEAAEYTRRQRSALERKIALYWSAVEIEEAQKRGEK